ncbi:MAG TPA: HIT family protein [Epulopiscium sp.]|nr:HIT family protein [Candidatus Epulonipiscium sp.]
MSEECIFCEINSGRMPSITIYENEEFRVMLDRFPAAKGHILIIPQKHVKDIYDLEPESAGRLFELTTRFASIIKRTFGNDGLNIIQNNGKAAGQTVPHYHLHMIPRYENDCIQLGWALDKEVTPETLEEYAAQIKSQM